MGKSFGSVKKNFAITVNAVFIFTQFSLCPGVYADFPQSRLTDEASRIVFPQDPQKISVPDDIGDVRQFFKGRGNQTVVLVQDAHAIPDAQRSIQRLIEHFQKDYGLGLVGLEGAASELDPRIFRSFPDRELLKKTIDGYVEDAELVGSVAAAVLSDRPTVYHGLEDWSAYEEGLALFLAADKKRDMLSADLKRISSEIQSSKQRVYSPELLALDRELGAFRLNGANLLDVLKKLAAVKPPAPGTELAVLVEENAATGKDQNDFDVEVRSAAKDVLKKLESTEKESGGREAVKKFQEKYQEYQTSRITAQAFMLVLREICDQNGLKVRISGKLREAVGKQKKLRDIEGTKFFDDFRAYAQSVKESLFRTAEEKKLDGQSERLELLGKFIDLELDSDGWKKYQTLEAGGSEAFLGFDPKDFENHKAFYKNTEKRDQAFMRNLFALMASRNQAAAMVITGGFHTEGLIAQLKAKDVSYVLIMPKMKRVPAETSYREQMRGNVSWKSYFEPEDGKVNLYKAFVRAVRDRLLNRAGSRSGGRDTGQSQNEKSSAAVISDPAATAQMLKGWRDQIIRDLASSGSAVDAGQYTLFIDEKVEKSEPKSNQEIFGKIDRFIGGLKQLQNDGRLNPQSVTGLLSKNTFQQVNTGGHLMAPSDPGVQAALLGIGPQQEVQGLAQGAAAREEMRATQAETQMESLTDETAGDLARIADENRYWGRILQLMIESNDRNPGKRQAARVSFLMNRFDQRIADLLEEISPDVFFRNLADKVMNRFIEQETEKALPFMVQNAIALGMEERLRDLVIELAEDEGRRLSFLMSDPDGARRDVMAQLLASPKYAGAYFGALKNKVLAQLDGIKVYRGMGKIMEVFGSQMTTRSGHQYLFLTYDQMIAMIANSGLGNREIPGTTTLVTYDGEYVQLDRLRGREGRYQDVNRLFPTEFPMSLVAFDVTAALARSEFRSVDSTDASLSSLNLLSGGIAEIAKRDFARPPFENGGFKDFKLVASEMDFDFSQLARDLAIMTGDDAQGLANPLWGSAADAGNSGAPGFGAAGREGFPLGAPPDYNVEIDLSEYKEIKSLYEKIDPSALAKILRPSLVKGETPYQTPLISEDAVLFLAEVRAFMRNQKEKGKEKNTFLLKDFVDFMENQDRDPKDFSDLYGRLADYQAMADLYEDAKEKIKGEIKAFKEEGKPVSPETEEMLYRARDQVYELLIRLQILRRGASLPDSKFKKLMPLAEGLIGQLTRKLTQREGLLEAAGLPSERERTEEVSGEQLQSLIRSAMDERAKVLGRALQASDMVEILRDLQIQGFIQKQLEIDALDEENKLAIAWTNENGVMVPMDDPQLIAMALDGLWRRGENAIDEIAAAVEARETERNSAVPSAESAVPDAPIEQLVPAPVPGLSLGQRMRETMRNWLGNFSDTVVDRIASRQKREQTARQEGQAINTSAPAVFIALQIVEDLAEGKIEQYTAEDGSIGIVGIEGKVSSFFSIRDSGNKADYDLALNAWEWYEYLWDLSASEGLKYPKAVISKERERRRFVETALRSALPIRTGSWLSEIMTEDQIVNAASACASPLVKIQGSDAYRALEAADAKMASEYGDDFVGALTLPDKQEVYRIAFDKFKQREAQTSKTAPDLDPNPGSLALTTAVENAGLVGADQAEPDMKRSELRADGTETAVAPEDAVAIENFNRETLPKLMSAITEGKELGGQAASQIVLYVKNRGADQLAEIMRDAAARSAQEARSAGKAETSIEAFNAGVAEVLKFLEEHRDKEKGGTIGLVLPAQLSPTFIKHFVNALGTSHLEAVAVLGKLPTDVAKKIRDEYGVTVRSLNDYLKTRINKPIPTGVFDAAFKMEKVKKMYGFKLDMTDVPEDDVLARDFAEFVQLAAVITADRLIRGDTEGKLASPEALKESLLQQLNIFERAIDLNAQGQFVVKAVVAKAILEERAREKVRVAA
jgi:hypothetical protein